MKTINVYALIRNHYMDVVGIYDTYHYAHEDMIRKMKILCPKAHPVEDSIYHITEYELQRDPINILLED